MDQLQGCVSAEDQNVDASWQVGSECAVYVGKDSRWYRAVISEITEDQYKVGRLGFNSASNTRSYCAWISTRSVCVCLVAVPEFSGAHWRSGG